MTSFHVRGVVRNFFLLADKNHLLFVEVFLRQSFAGKACALIHRNYEAVDVHFRTIKEARAQAVALGREKHITMINEVRQKRAALDAEELEGEAEFSFEVQAQDLESSSLIRTNKGSDKTGDQSVVPHSGNQVPNTVSTRAKNWTKVEDRYLKKLYQKYRHLPSVFELLSYEDMFQVMTILPYDVFVNKLMITR
jgi:timeless